MPRKHTRVLSEATRINCMCLQGNTKLHKHVHASLTASDAMPSGHHELTSTLHAQTQDQPLSDLPSLLLQRPGWTLPDYHKHI